MAMYQCHCGKFINAGDKHECKPKEEPYNVLVKK